jgi:acyl-CoA reductase-like NAD-dependent aldehyde dehydrogenase
MSPKLWAAVFLAVVLACSHFLALRTGKAIVRGQWDAQRLVDAETARKAIEANRAKEQALQATLSKAQDDASKREKNLRAAAGAARGERDRLRDAIATATSGLPSDTSSTVLARAATLGGLLNECSAEYSDLAAKADGHSSDAVMLRDGWPKP